MSKQDKKKLEPKDVTFKALFGIGDKFRFTNTADGRSGVYAIIGIRYHEFTWDFEFEQRCSEVCYDMKLCEGNPDRNLPSDFYIEEARLAVIEDEKSELIVKGYRFRIEKIQKQ